ncbi:MAG: aminodeoxychorismate synthase component I [Neorhizobium sp.]|nr:aminodeoxychorismate synthase component I [Neorhizobium sp.]
MTHSPFALFRDDRAGRTLFFERPKEIVIARKAKDILPALERLEEARKAGCWLAGYISYEAGHIFEEKLRPLIADDRDTPLIAIGLFDAPSPDRLPAAKTDGTEPTLTDFRAAWDFDTYGQKFERLHRHIRNGDCYQANLTMPIEARFTGEPLALFNALVEHQPVSYGALIDLTPDLGGPTILSRSPELFFSVDAERMIETHPMKGTAPRGKDAAEDAAILAKMLADEKTQAENRMIVDLLRNDISAISEVGTLSVPKLFDIETYPTLHQMVSHVRARLRPEIGLPDILQALFPCGSITGAPKMWAMRILADLETGPRDVYCGAIGWCDPNGPMRFSVAIRTITLFRQGRAVFNVGGGIVFDSTAEAEYQECLLKARFAAQNQPIWH